MPYKEMLRFASNCGYSEAALAGANVGSCRCPAAEPLWQRNVLVSQFMQAAEDPGITPLQIHTLRRILDLLIPVPIPPEQRSFLLPSPSSCQASLLSFGRDVAQYWNSPSGVHKEDAEALVAELAYACSVNPPQVELLRMDPSLRGQYIVERQTLRVNSANPASIGVPNLVHEFAHHAQLQYSLTHPGIQADMITVHLKLAEAGRRLRKEGNSALGQPMYALSFTEQDANLWKQDLLQPLAQQMGWSLTTVPISEI